MSDSKRAYSFTKGGLKKFNAVLGVILKEIKPGKDDIERVTSYSNEIISRLHNAVPKDVEIIAAGSIAHGTNLKGSSDIDIFMLFPKTLEERDMEKQALAIAKGIVQKHRNESYIIKYAEHPYLKLRMNDLGIDADIVPAFKIADSKEMGSAVDRTQLHTKFVVSHLSERQKDDVRLAKFLLDQHDIYGAEAATEGFSGYLCELLIHHFGSLHSLIEGMANLSVTIAIDAAPRRVLLEKDLESMVKKFNSRFIVVDPTDPSRNVAANVSEESLARLVLLSRRIIKTPSRATIFGAEYSEADSSRKMEKLGSALGVDIYALAFGTDDIAEDILWQQARKLRKRIHEMLEDCGFMPVFSLEGIENNSAVLTFMVNPARFGSVSVKGPSAFMKGASDEFTSAHSRSPMLYLIGERLAAIDKPKFSTPKELLERFSKGKEKGMPTHLKTKGSRLFVNRIPEAYSKVIYRSLISKRIA